MNSKDAYDFIDAHIEREIVGAYYGNCKKFDQAMRCLHKLVVKDMKEKKKHAHSKTR
jgi:hypothetical protein